MVAVRSGCVIELGFASEEQAFPDPDRPPLRRANPRSVTPYGTERVETHRCEATDWFHDPSTHPELFTFGFDRVDLTGLGAIQETCRTIDAAGRISDEDALAIRTALDGAVLPTSSGRDLTVLFVADEGLIMRTAGPNRLALVGPRSIGMNEHGPASAVHSDQDVHGTPLKQIMAGKAPTLFRHDSPDGHNHDASLMLVNVWIPLHQITQPLALCDGRSLDRLSHQLCYGLPTESFLERDDEQSVNDIWTFLHAPEQRWYFRSEMDHREAYVFDTLSTAHGAATLPGEDVAERCYLALEAAEDAIERGDLAGAAAAVRGGGDVDLPEGTTPALRAAIEAMAALGDEISTGAADLAGEAGEAWVRRAREARQRVVRRSIELRMVVSVEDRAEHTS